MKKFVSVNLENALTKAENAMKTVMSEGSVLGHRWHRNKAAVRLAALEVAKAYSPERHAAKIKTHKLLNKQQKAIKVKVYKAKTKASACLPKKKVYNDLDMDRYADRCRWEQLKADIAECRNAEKNRKPEPVKQSALNAAEQLVRKMEKAAKHQETKASVDISAEKIVKANRSIDALIAAIDDEEAKIRTADLNVNVVWVKADQMLGCNMAHAEGVAKAKANVVAEYVTIKAKAELVIDELKNKIVKLYRKIEKLQDRIDLHKKTVDEAKAASDLKREHDEEERNLYYLFRYGDFWAEYIQSADKSVREAVEEYNDVDFRYARMKTRYEAAETKLGELHAQRKSLRGKRTKIRNKYNEADEKTQAELYAKMISIVAETEAIEEAYDKAVIDAEKAADDLVAFELQMDDMKAAADKKLAEACEYKQAILAEIRHEKKYASREEALKDAFECRYERAEFVPEKEKAFRYKVRNISAKQLFSHMNGLLAQMAALVAPKEEDREAGWLQKGRELWAEFQMLAKQQTGAYRVKAKDCVVNNVTASAMSDIMGIVYGLKTASKEMVLVNYDIVNSTKVYWQFVDEDYDESQNILHDFRVELVNRLLKDGLVMEFEDGSELAYDMLASSNSQQKKGQAYLGEHETMVRTEELREFGWIMDEAIENRTDNAVEWLKRNATLTTPSKIIKGQNGETVKVSRILMMDDVEFEQMFDHVTTVTGERLTSGQRKALKVTKFDGQAIWLKKGFASTQGRGPALKYMAIALPDYKLPEFTPDGRRIADYDILMTRSCWKAGKMGQTWEQFVATCERLAKQCPGYDLLRSVRYSDREIGDEENPRDTARQMTQQFIYVDDAEVDGLTRKTRQWLKHNKQYRTILSDLGEWDKPESERTAIARLFNRFPQLVMHPAIQQWIKNNWEGKRNKACSGKLRVHGMYPYICQDPIAMIQILLEGRDPKDTTLGVVKAGTVDLPKTRNGVKVYGVRYPANYLVGMVLTALNHDEFRDIGNVAVLSYHDDTIVRADGDFDGDEMLFLFDKNIIDLMERTIEWFKPELIDFSHGKVACNKPFGDRSTFARDVSEALVRAQEYNKVGLYSNLAVICLQNASLAARESNGKLCKTWLNAAIYAHVGAILCLDMVKGADVSKELWNKLEKLNKDIRNKFKMPWNQQFSHKELTSDDIDARTMGTQDRIAGSIYDDVGAFAIEFDEDDVVYCDEAFLRSLLPVGFDTTSVRSFSVSEELLDKIRGCRFEDDTDKKTWEALNNRCAVGMKDWLLLGWHNASSLTWKMSGVELAEKKAELYSFVREALIANVRDNEWIETKTGRKFTKTEKYASLVKNAIAMGLGFWVDNKGAFIERDGGIDPERRGSWTMFVLKVFAEDILAVADGLSDEVVEAMLEKIEEVQDDPIYLDEYVTDVDELRELMDDGSMSFSACDYDEEYDYVA